ncbi:SulP family inorganic anion transporter [Sediminicola luteus]|uniref:Sulfate transporter n=1 Tax=Sediminicola luteus TaxID=319238 RepID=A0A2A4GG25_9FLAO|nr:SulP family inorganic anion transporter [Sediminicola luteus]PCE66725.1 sulfate transporter [Sediminicola luteus]
MVTKEKKHITFAKDLPKNMFSGFVVSLIALPLGLGLALASGAPPISGIMAAIVGGVVMALLGGSHVTISGPGNGLVIVILATIMTLGGGDMYQGFLYTLAAIVCSGVLILLFGFLKMGRLADFFPASAIEGMLAAIGIGILSKQFHIMIGNNGATGSIMELLGKIPEAFVSVWQSMDSGIWIVATVGLISLAIMVFYSKLRNPYFQLIPAPMWVLLLSVGFSYVYIFLKLPFPLDASYLVQIPEDVLGNLARPDFAKLGETEFILAVFSITLITSIESLLSIKAVDKLDPANRRSNVNRDLKALGIANIISGFLGGLNVVVVIARSSVNVNNRATNRSANLFHALFLAVFILLFEGYIKKVPLAALAAILVYTGYKLATPKNLKKIAKIGTEQILIFATTLITTLFTNLITGISAGIVVTLLIHIVMNRSLHLFFGNLAKPNILMFKEADGGTFYISVKYFCSFMNFYKLKNKLDAISEDETVVVDFSMCDFVDHTVMQGLENYTDTFAKKGGSIEIVGLDKHGTKSGHPFAVRKVLPLNRIKPIEQYLTKRQRLLESTAKEFKWQYDPKRNTDTQFLSDFVFFQNREIKYTYNRLSGPEGKFNLFDLEFTEGAFIAKEVVKTTVLHYSLEDAIPVFSLDKDGLMRLLYNLAGFSDIDIADHPDFNKRYYLSGPDEKQIRDLMTDELILFFESNPYYHVESNGKSLLIQKKERLLSVQEIKALIFYGQQLCKLLRSPSFVGR